RAATAKFYTDKFFHLCAHIPKFDILCERILRSPEDVFLFAKYMQVHAAAGRTTDISTLKSSFHSYFPYVVISGSNDLVIPPPGPGQLAGLKARNGGYCTTSTGRLIVPIDERSAFDRDPTQYCKKKIVHHKDVANTVRHKKRHQADRPEPRDDNKSYPSYLFPTDLKYDNTRPHRHIFKGDFLIDIGHLLSTEERWSGDNKQRTGHHLHTALHRLLTVEYQAWQEDVEHGDFRQSEDTFEWNVFAFINECVLHALNVCTRADLSHSKVFGGEAGAPDQQNPDEFGEDEDNDDTDIRAQMLKARMAELEERRERRAKGLRDAPAEPAETQVRSQSPSVETISKTSAVVDVTDDDWDELFAGDPS
ncbi:hypothetical protein DICSQDRAFT_130650, partial [Dichomitus squalens LYAD-421 SS1]